MSKSHSREELERIGDNLRRIRISKGLTQEQSAKAVGITQSYLSEIERGRKTSAMVYILRLINFYQTDYESVFGALDNSHFRAFSENELTAFSLLKELLSGADSGELSTASDIYIKLCIYILMRRLYSANPHNTQSAFSVPVDEAEEKVQSILSETPKQLELFAKRGRVKQTELEVSAEHSQKLRDFIAECEKIISKDKPLE